MQRSSGRAVASFACLCVLLGSIACSTTPRILRGKWILARTEHFEIVSGLSERRTVALAEALEVFRFVANRVTTASADAARVPTRIYLFDRRGWAEMGSGAGFAGSFRPGMRENLVLMNGDGYDSTAILFHEYVHFLMSNDPVAYPLWYSEGFAEFMATIRRRHEAWILGGASGRAFSLRSGRLSAERLVSLRDLSGLDSREISAVYAQAWALVRHLVRGRPEGTGAISTQLRDYLGRIEQGEELPTAFREAFEIDFDEIESVFEDYERKRVFDAWSLPTDILPEPRPPVVERLSGAAVAEQMGWLAIVTGRYTEAERYFAAALATDPAASRAHAGMGDAMKFQGRWAEATPHYERSLAVDDTNALNHLDYGEYLFDRGKLDPDWEPAETWLEQARSHFVRSWKLDPDIPETYAIYGASYLGPDGDGERAVEMLEHAHGLHPGEPSIRFLLAQAYASVDRKDDAIRMLIRIRVQHGGGRSTEVEQLLAELQGTEDPATDPPPPTE